MEVSIEEEPQLVKVRHEIEKLAKEIGFSEKEIGEISIVVTELAENLIKHKTVNGKIIYSPITDEKRKGIEIVSVDEGPGIAKIEAVLEDGFSTTGSLGIGLGAVKRLMTEFTINSNVQKDSLGGLGTRIVTRKYLPFAREPEKVNKAFTRYSVFSKSKTDETYNGDNYFLHHYEDKTMIAVIDGLGSGRMAFEASLRARQFLVENYHAPLEEIIHGIHQSLRLTRGVAISIALISDTANTLEYVGIGNVMGRVYNSPTPLNLVNYNGTLGIALQRFKVFSYPWQVGNIIILTTDGISTKYNFDKDPSLLKQHPIIIANAIFRDFSKTHDDATILVGGPA